jgi:glycosyltransferase involved in cell wall biosynthesis
MRILHLVNKLTNTGNGIINVAVDASCLQQSLGHQVAIASNGGDFTTLIAEYGVTHFHFNQERNPRNLVHAAKRYQEIIKSFNPDVVHCHMMTGVLIARFLKQRSKYQVFATVHNEFQKSASLMRLADQVIVLSEAGKVTMISRGIPANKIHIISNGCLASPRQKDQSDKPKLALLQPAIVSVAGMNSRKGIVELIQSMDIVTKRFPNAHLYLVGNGPEIEAFRTLASDLNLLENVHFEGFQPDPQSYLRSCSIFALVSRNEPYSLALIEARGAGCAIVATNVGGNPNILDNGVAGMLVAPNSPSEIAKAFEELIEDPNFLATMQQRSSTNVHRFLVSRMAEETLDLYKFFSES